MLKIRDSIRTLLQVGAFGWLILSFMNLSAHSQAGNVEAVAAYIPHILAAIVVFAFITACTEPR